MLLAFRIYRVHLSASPLLAVSDTFLFTPAARSKLYAVQRGTKE